MAISLAAQRSFGPVTIFVVFKFLVTVKTDYEMYNQGSSAALMHKIRAVALQLHDANVKLLNCLRPV